MMRTFDDLPFQPAGRGGVLATVDFPNGFGASIVRHQFSYGGPEGLYEVAVLRDGRICYSTPVAEDVVGYLDEAQVLAVLADIEALPPAGDAPVVASEDAPVEELVHPASWDDVDWEDEDAVLPVYEPECPAETGWWMPYYCDACANWHDQWVDLGIAEGTLWETVVDADGDCEHVPSDFPPTVGGSARARKALTQQAREAQRGYYQHVADTGDDPLNAFYPPSCPAKDQRWSVQLGTEVSEERGADVWAVNGPEGEARMRRTAEAAGYWDIPPVVRDYFGLVLEADQRVRARLITPDLLKSWEPWDAAGVGGWTWDGATRTVSAVLTVPDERDKDADAAAYRARARAALAQLAKEREEQQS